MPGDQSAGPNPNTNQDNENVKTRYCGDLAELADLDLLTRQLECPACFEVPLPPIFLCVAGHNVCFSCRSQLTNCPLCKSRFSNTRNFVMEGVISSSKFHCNYKPNGCKDLILGEKFQDHCKTCKFRNGAIVDEENSSNENETSVHLPPTVVRRVGGCCQWIPSSSNYAIPEDAVEGGFENGTQLYVARSSFNGGCFPGKLNTLTLQHSFPLGDEERITTEYEVLVAADDSVQWVIAVDGQLPPNPVIGGRTELGEALYVGRCGHEGELIVGWVLSCKKSVMITYNNEVVTNNAFEVLVKTELGIALDLSAD